jgi:DNA topoisomerase-1
VAATRKKKKSLVIVESPAKARTINKYLGPDFEVLASKGHVRDLPKSRFGIDIENGWVPTYRPLKDRKDVLSLLKKHAASADTVYLAPDPDREGEAIAWHLKEALGLKDERVRRVTFNEITKTAVQAAFANPGQIDPQRVAAQEARRFLDRVVGFKLSPLLSQKLASDLTAGRVQSVAVRLIVDREREIQKFVPEEYWKITALLSPENTLPRNAVTLAKPKVKALPKAKESNGEDDGEAKPEKPALQVPPGAFLAELAEWDGKKFEAGKEDQALGIARELDQAAYVISKVEQKDRAEKAPPPFTTSTLQQQASIRLRYPAKKTMMLAQHLYQGVELGSEGSVALITYMRTDSTRVSNDALKMVRGHIGKQYGDKYLPEKPNAFASGKSAQEAHEAIRPTDLAYTPERVAKFLPSDQLKLYTLIYRRFVASQMTPAVFAVTNIEVTAAKGLFKTQGKILKFDGYRRVLAPAGKSEDALLPALAERQTLDLLQLLPTQHFTQPPPRYNEASLIRTLEKEGIGRPSTYASILNKIQERKYVELKERKFFATPTGMTVTDLLVEHFQRIMDLKFTSHMEEELDLIEMHKAGRNDVLEEFYGPFKLALEEAQHKMGIAEEKCPKCGKQVVERRGRFGKFFACSGYPECDFVKRSAEKQQREPPKPTEHKCPTCGEPMVQRMSRRGAFLGCSAYPKCKTTMNFDAEGKPVLASKPTEYTCDKCGEPMVLREGPRGPFLACTGYPKCKNAMDVDAEGKPVKPIETGIACEKCGRPMVIKKGPRGPFLGCSGYPGCRSTKPMSAELKEKFKDVLPAPAPKVDLPKVEVNEPCPECGGPMKLRHSTRGKTKGYFLGCARYPKCKGTKEASPDLIDQIKGAGVSS